MKVVVAAVLAGALAASVTHVRAGAEGQQSATKPAPKGTTGDTAKTIPPPINVEVIAVDPQAKTITVKEIAAVPVPPGKTVEVKLPVPATATGQKLSDTKAGEEVAVTCEVKPTVHPAAGVPVVLTDCTRVIKIDPKS